MTTETNAAEKVGIWATFRESPVAVKAVLGGVFVNRLGGFLNIFLVLYMTTSRHKTPEQAATALAVYGLGAVVGVLIGGSLADRLGARNATIISMGGSAVLIASLLYLPSYPLLLVAVAIVGIVSQIYRPASATLLSDLTPENRQVMMFAMYRFGLNLGTTAAPLIGFLLYNLDGQQYTLLFWGEALVALAYAILAMIALPRREPRQTDPAAVAAAKESAGTYMAVLRDRRYTVYLVAMFFNSVVYIQYLSTLPLDVNASHVKIFWYSLAVSLNGFIVIAFELLLTKISQTWPMRFNVAVAFGLVGVGVAFYGLPLVPAVIVGGTLIWTLGEIIGGPAVFAYPAIAGPAHLKGRYIGSFQFVFGLGSAVGPVIGAALFIHLGHAVWPVLAIGSVIAATLGAISVRPPTKTPALSPTSETDLDMDNAPVAVE